MSTITDEGHSGYAGWRVVWACAAGAFCAAAPYQSFAIFLRPVAEELSRQLGIEVPLAPDCVGPDVERMVKALQPGQVLLLENVRFHPEEEKNDPGFSKQLAALIRPDDLIWIHDYHLIPLAAELRRRGVTNRIGYFHHIPWPSADVIGALPFSSTLVRTIAAYDLVGMQTELDARNLIDGLVTMCAGRTDGQRVRLGARETLVQTFPIGIDVEAFRRLAAASTRQCPANRALPANSSSAKASSSPVPAVSTDSERSATLSS